MVIRKKYIEAIEPFLGKPVIKVISGVRRCGKSTLMQQLIERLVSRGVARGSIVYINKELYEFDHIRNYADLHDYYKFKTKGAGNRNYLFVDEIQEIAEWERCINSLFAEGMTDIVITGSNASLLSSELATFLTGRYVEFRIGTLSFKEFCVLFSASRPGHTSQHLFDLYVKFGGFPGIHHMEWDETVIRQYLHSIYSTILLKDVVVRKDIRDAQLLEQLGEFLIDNSGKITTSKSISDYIRSQRRKVAVETVQSYLNYFTEAMLFNKVRRLDIRGKRLLETFEKYYPCDPGLRFAVLGYTPRYLASQLETVVYLELISLGYEVYIGKADEFEVDFVAEKGDKRIYIQVCATLGDPATTEREYRSLEQIPDHYPKMIMSLDSGFETSGSGIMWMNIIDFLTVRELP